MFSLITGFVGTLMIAIPQHLGFSKRYQVAGGIITTSTLISLLF